MFRTDSFARPLRIDGQCPRTFSAIVGSTRAPLPRTLWKLLIDYLNYLAPTWLYQILNVLDPDKIPMLQQKVSHINTGHMLRERVDFFETLGNNSTFILVLDNPHWSDKFSLDLINFLMFRCSPAKLLIIVSYRPCEDGPGARRIAEMRAELSNRGLCQELSMQKHQS